MKMYVKVSCMLIAVVVVLFPNYLLHGQEKIWQTDPDYFESFPEEQLEEWTDLLWSLKSANLVWPEKVNALKAFPWVDYTWIESSLLTQSNIIISELLLSVYADEPTKATIEWLYDIKAHKKAQVHKSKLNRLENIHVISSARSELSKLEKQKWLSPDYQQRISLSTNEVQAHIISTQGNIHQYPRWRTPRLLGGYISFKRNDEKRNIELIAGRVRAKFGTGLIGQSVPFLMLTSTGSFLKASASLSGSLNRSPQQSLFGVGIKLQYEKLHLIWANGLSNLSVEENNLTNSDYQYYQIASIRRSNEWGNPELKPSRDIWTQLFHAMYSPIERFSFSIQAQYLGFKKLMFNNEELKPRFDYEVGFGWTALNNTKLSAHLAMYDGQPQMLLATVSENRIMRLSYLFGMWKQTGTDPFRRTPMLIGTTGNQRLMMIKGQLFNKNSNGLSFLLAFIAKTNPYELAASSDRIQAEIRFPWKHTSSGSKQVLTARFFQQLDRHFDNSLVNKDRIQLNWLIDVRMNKSLTVQLRVGANTQTQITAFTKPSLFFSKHIYWQNRTTKLGLRLNEMIVNELNAMQRLDAWSMGNQLRDVVVRNSSSTAYQLYCNLQLHQKVKLLINYTQQLNNEPKVVQVTSNEQVLSLARQWVNMEIRLDL